MPSLELPGGHAFGQTGELDALVFGAATTSGARLGLEGAGVFTVREGDDSAYADLSLLALRVQPQGAGIVFSVLNSLASDSRHAGKDYLEGSPALDIEADNVFSNQVYVSSTGASMLTSAADASVALVQAGVNIGSAHELAWDAGTDATDESPDTFIGRASAGVLRIGATTGTADGTLALLNLVTTGYMSGAEMTAPSAPATNGFRIFAEDNGAGKTRLMVLFATGAAQQIAIEP